MPGDYGVVMDDLAAAATTFHRESTALAHAAPSSLPTPAAGGDGADEAISALASAVVALHLGLAGAIEEHADKLTACHDQYTKTDVGIRHLYDDLLHQLEG